MKTFKQFILVGVAFILLIVGIILTFGEIVDERAFDNNILMTWILFIATKVIGIICFYILYLIAKKQVG